MNGNRRIVLIITVCIIAIASYYRFGYPLRNVIEQSFCINASLATAATIVRDTYLPTNREVSGKPYLNCKAAVAIDNATSEMLLHKNAGAVRPIASITKLMTALVLIDLNFDWSQVVKITREDARSSAKSRLKMGEEFYANDLFYASLICSDNRAARALARSTGLPNDEFVRLMNEKAHSLGMYDTRFVEVTGLSEQNMSTALDCARLINTALDQKLISAACTTNRYSFRSLNHKRRRNITNTNKLLQSMWSVSGGKTGYILESGYCLATRLKDGSGHDITVVILGAPGKNTRFSVARKLAAWTFKNLSRFEQEKQHATRGIDGT